MSVKTLPKDNLKSEYIPDILIVAASPQQHSNSAHRVYDLGLKKMQ